MTSTTSQAVRDARAALGVAVKIGGHYADIRATTDAFETAVRADEAAGLVDILARLVKRHWCLCPARAYEGVFYGPMYIDHTPDCPWVEGMIAVAERQG